MVWKKFKVSSQVMPAFLTLCLGAFNASCDLEARTISVTTFGTSYNNREDHLYCVSAHPFYYSSMVREYNTCLNTRRIYRTSYDNGRHTCRSGGVLSYRNVCRDRRHYSGYIGNECVSTPNCDNDGYFPRLVPVVPVPLSAYSLDFKNALLRVNETKSIKETLRSVSPESVALNDKFSLNAATLVRNAVVKSFDGDRGPLLLLGFHEDEVEEFMVRQDPGGASEDTYNAVAKGLDIPTNDLRSFMGNVLGLVVDTRWEIYNQQNPSPR